MFGCVKRSLRRRLIVLFKASVLLLALLLWPRTLKRTMETQRNPKQTNFNPNWAILQQRLKIRCSKSSRPSNCSEIESTSSILGKRKERSDAELNASLNSILDPVNSDFSLTDVVGIDCEMVGVSQGNKSALGRVTLINKWGNVVYDEFVRPVERVVDFRTHISGIRPRDLKKAKDFRVVQKKVAELIHGKILVGHALRNDLKALLLSHPKRDMRDTSEYHLFQKEGSRRALKHLAAEFLGVKIQDGEHCPIEDARAAMLLYQRNRRDWEKSEKDKTKLKQKQKQKQKQKRGKSKLKKTLNKSVVLNGNLASRI